MLRLVAGAIPQATSVLGVLRLFRAMRFVRAVRSIKLFRELYRILHGFIGSLKAIFWATILLFILLTMWSLVAVEILHPLNKIVARSGAYEGCERCGRAFESVMASNLTFIQQIIAGDSWGLITIPIMEAYPATSIIFCMVIITINLGLMNLILSVIVDTAQQARAEDTQFILQERDRAFQEAKERLAKLCRQMDVNDDGTLSLDELMGGFKIPEFEHAMKLMDVRQEDMSTLWNIMDEDGSGDVSYDEFVEQLHKMKCQDDHMMLVFIKSHVKDMQSRIKEKFEALDEKAASWDASLNWLVDRVGSWGVGQNTGAANGVSVATVEGILHRRSPPESDCSCGPAVFAAASRVPTPAAPAIALQQPDDVLLRKLEHLRLEVDRDWMLLTKNMSLLLAELNGSSILDVQGQEQRSKRHLAEMRSQLDASPVSKPDEIWSPPPDPPPPEVCTEGPQKQCSGQQSRVVQRSVRHGKTAREPFNPRALREDIECCEDHFVQCSGG
eukprot:gnl/TRDRNA2_/TRDRNA2_175800_c3_seq31.p1 gnl/TRDRNA2_/TRDRNA2_175800_c3~~gnl/TRDRNA2_/TRDRNA2_175800_c3_seq31.p1  ORF type:complete len:584 (+),score=76.87 gnl/TRDRNA2_/TRDRNA2_175800_c3_seq31:255-1754(+)